MANYDAGSVEIQISTSASNTQQALQGLLVTLKSTHSELEKMVPVFKSINQLANGLKVIQKLDISKLNSQITAMGKSMSLLDSQFKKNPLSNFSKQSMEASTSVNKLVNALKGVNTVANMDTRAMYENLNKLSRISSSGLQAYSTALSEIKFETITKSSTAINNLANGLQKLQGLNVSNVSGQLALISGSVADFSKSLAAGVDVTSLKAALDTLNKMPTSLEKIQALDLDNLGKVFSSLSTQITPFLAQLKEAAAELSDLATIVKKIDSTSFTKLTKSTDNLNTSTKRLRTNLFEVGKLYAIWNNTKFLAQGITQSIALAADYVEAVNIFTVSMGEHTQQATRFVNQIAEAFGAAVPELLKYQATFNNLITSMGGITSGAAYGLSETLMGMALDFSSLFNTTVDSAMSKFQAALTQQVRPIRSTSGFDITQNTLQSYLPEIGIFDRTISELSQVEERLVIIYALSQQMWNVGAIGDYARTIESAANQLKIMQYQVAETGRWIGSLILNYLQPILPYLNAIIMVVKEVVKWLSLLLGFEVTGVSDASAFFETEDAAGGFDDMADSAGGAADAAGDLADKLDEVKDATLGIDELNVISPVEPVDTSTSSGGGGGGGGIGDLGAIDSRLLDALGKYDNLMDEIVMKATLIRDRLMEWLGFTKSLNYFTGEIEWDLVPESRFDKAMHFVEGFFAGVASALEPINALIQSVFGGLFNWIAQILGEMTADEIYELAEGFGTFVGEILKFKAIVGSITAVATAFTTLKSAAAVGGVAAGIKTFSDTMTIAFGSVSLKNIAEYNKIYQALGATKLTAATTTVSKFGSAVVTSMDAARASMSTFTKLAGGAVAAFATFEVFTEVFERLAKGTLEFDTALWIIIPTIGIAATAMYLFLGPIGLVIGGIAAVAGAVVGYSDGIKQSAEDTYKASEAYEILAKVQDESAESIQNASDSIRDLNDAQRQITENVLDVQSLEDMVDRIFEIANSANASTSEMNEMQALISTVNGMNIDGLKLSIDETTGALIQEEEAIYSTIEALEQKAKMEGLQDALAVAYREQAEAAIELKKAEENLAIAQTENTIAASELWVAQDAVREGFGPLSAAADFGLWSLKHLHEGYNGLVIAAEDAAAAEISATEAVDKWTEARDLSDSIINDIITQYGQLGEAPGTVAAEIEAGNQAVIDSTANVGQSVAENLSAPAESVDGSAYTANLATDIAAGEEQVALAAGGVAETATTAATDSFNEYGPEVGEAYTDTIVTGMENGEASVEQASKDVAQVSLSAFEAKLPEFKSVGSDIVGEIGAGITANESALTAPLESIAAKIQGFMNAVTTATNETLSKMVQSYNSINLNTEGNSSYVAMQSVTFPAYQSGGYVDKGIFAYNDGDSAEMIGKINGKAAVVNNSQIASALAQAFIPMMQPMLQEVVDSVRELRQEGDIVIEVNDREIARATRTGEQKLGAQVNDGGVFANA